jgi:ferredoxin
MVRKIIEIDREKCDGCGLCVAACHEGAIALENGKAKLVREDYCDGLGNCLPACPAGAIRFTEREAAAFNPAALEKPPAAAGPGPGQSPVPPAGGCPGARAAKILRPAGAAVPANAAEPPGEEESQLGQWPVQIKLVPVNAPYFEGASLLIAADCAAYAYANFHRRFMRDRITIIGCPKLDEGDYREKLTAILQANAVKSLTVVRMEVPCCGGIAQAAVDALRDCGKMIPWRVVVLSTDGRVLEDN